MATQTVQPREDHARLATARAAAATAYVTVIALVAILTAGIATVSTLV